MRLEMRKFIYLARVGDRAGMLVVAAIIPPRQKLHMRRLWCFCDCGGEGLVSHEKWKRALGDEAEGHCGCKRRLSRELPSIHSNEYKTWLAIKSRCKNPGDEKYKRYAGRGIRVHPDIDASFARFFQEVGPKPTKIHTIDRIDNEKGYAPGNMRWAYRSQQQLNRSNNRMLTAHGKTQSIVQWARELNVAQRTITGRLLRGKTLDEALSPSRLTRRLITHEGKTQDLAKWAREVGLHYGSLSYHIRKGISLAEAINVLRRNKEK